MDNYLQQGIVLAKAGDKPRAFDLLMRASQIPATSEQAWLWLSSVVNDDSERLFCLDNVLRINSDNAVAKRGAAILRQKGIFPAVPIYPEPQRTDAFHESRPRQLPSSKSSAAPARNQTAPVPTTKPATTTRLWNRLEEAGISGFFSVCCDGIVEREVSSGRRKISNGERRFTGSCKDRCKRRRIRC